MNVGASVLVGQSQGGEDTSSCWLIKFIHNLNSSLLTLGITSCAVIVVVKGALGSFFLEGIKFCVIIIYALNLH